MATFRSASSANGGADTATSNFSITLPTGWAAGDVVIITLAMGTLAGPPTYSATGWTAAHASDQNSGGGQHTSGSLYRVMQGGDSNPTVSASVSGGKWAWSAICIQPGGGETLTVDQDATVRVTTTGSTTLTGPNAATFSAGSGVSVITYGQRASSSGATAISSTAMTNWTKNASAESSTATGTTNATRQVACTSLYRESVSGTVTPGNGTVNVNTCQNAYHYLVKATAAGSTSDVPTPRIRRQVGALLQM